MHKHFIFICIMLAFTACADKKLQSITFHSNIDDVLVSIDDQSCIAPCELIVKSDDLMLSATKPIESGDSLAYITGDNRLDATTVKDTELYVLGSVSASLLFTYSLVSATTTTSSVAISGIVASIVEDKPVALYYDTGSYYIYFPDKPYGAYALHEIEYTDFALRNFDQMQQELFYNEQPFIDAFSELTTLPNIRDLLPANPDPLSFLDALTMEKVKEIMNSRLSEPEKLAAISKLTQYSEESFTLTDTDFLAQLNERLTTRRTILRADTTKSFQHNEFGVSLMYVLTDNTLAKYEHLLLMDIKYNRFFNPYIGIGANFSMPMVAMYDSDLLYDFPNDKVQMYGLGSQIIGRYQLAFDNQYLLQVYAAIGVMHTWMDLSTGSNKDEDTSFNDNIYYKDKFFSGTAQIGINFAHAIYSLDGYFSAGVAYKHYFPSKRSFMVDDRKVNRPIGAIEFQMLMAW